MPRAAPLLWLSIPGLCRRDLIHLPRLNRLCGGRVFDLSIGFPAVTWPVEATMLTGKRPTAHGILANGMFDRNANQVEMWTFGNERIERPQIWDRLRLAGTGYRSAAWFPMLSKRSGAEFVCMPAPVHRPDGSESLWCYSQPESLYGELLEELGHFPLQHFWGPLANIQSSQWIADSAALVARRFRPDFFFIYLPHLDYAAQKHSPGSPEAIAALAALDNLIDRFAAQCNAAYDREPVWMVVSEYAINPTDHVCYPNRILRREGLLTVRESEDGEHLDFARSEAWALVDHQLSHVFVRDRRAPVIRRLVELFRNTPGIRAILDAGQQEHWEIAHQRCGDLVLVSEPSSWQAYYWWLDDHRAPAFARTVDIHRKPGYDPVELHFDPVSRSIPMDATRIGGSHGVPSDWVGGGPIATVSRDGLCDKPNLRDLDVAPMVLRHFGITEE
jgi:predicted AlkP superfamily pyrophosphatase or phosphodiesterase